MQQVLQKVLQKVILHLLDDNTYHTIYMINKPSGWTYLLIVRTPTSKRVPRGVGGTCIMQHMHRFPLLLYVLYTIIPAPPADPVRDKCP